MDASRATIWNSGLRSEPLNSSGAMTSCCTPRPHCRAARRTSRKLKGSVRQGASVGGSPLGRTANPSICQESILLLTMKPPKRSRTCGPFLAFKVCLEEARAECVKCVWSTELTNHRQRPARMITERMKTKELRREDMAL
jgi:hypothetical protein